MEAMQTDITMEKVPPRRFLSLYRTHIRRDFAPEERRPLAAILLLMLRGRYTCWRMMKDGHMAAYACFVHAEDTASALLDYFAVMPEMRGGGVGSAFLATLAERVDADGIIIEVEMPAHAENPEDAEIRTRRMAFYQRGGASLSQLGWYAFSVHYSLLWLPIRRPMDETALGADLLRLYGHTLTKWMLRKATRLYRLDDSAF